MNAININTSRVAYTLKEAAEAVGLDFHGALSEAIRNGELTARVLDSTNRSIVITHDELNRWANARPAFDPATGASVAEFVVAGGSPLFRPVADSRPKKRSKS